MINATRPFVMGSDMLPAPGEYESDYATLGMLSLSIPHLAGVLPPPNTPAIPITVQERTGAAAGRAIRSERRTAREIIFVSPIHYERRPPRQKAYPGTLEYPELREKAIRTLERGRATDAGKTLKALVLLHPKIDLSDITADFDAPSCYNEHHKEGTLLHIAATHITHETAVYLLSLGSGPDMVTHVGATPLHIAAANPRGGQIIDALLERNADINAICTGTGETPLMAAIWAGNIGNATLLLSRGANVHAGSFLGTHGHIGFNGANPLHYLFAADISEEEREELLDLLLTHHASLYHTDDAGRTPYIIALAIGDLASAETLLNAENEIDWERHFNYASVKALLRLNDITGEYGENPKEKEFLIPMIRKHLTLQPPSEGIDAFLETWFPALCFADQANDGNKAQETEIGRDPADVAVVSPTDSSGVKTREQAS